MCHRSRSRLLCSTNPWDIKRWYCTLSQITTSHELRSPMLLPASLTLFLLPLFAVPAALANNFNPHGLCKFGQPCWPSTREWTAFNQTLCGKLVEARPSAAPCHGADFNEAACENTTNNFLNQVWRAENPGALQDLCEFSKPYASPSRVSNSFCPFRLGKW